MTLEQILHGVRLRGELSGDLRGMEIRGLEYDSRRVEAGFLFFAFPGSRADGRQFPPEPYAQENLLDRHAVSLAAKLHANPTPLRQNGAWPGNLRARYSAARELHLDAERGCLLNHVTHGLALKVRHARPGQILLRTSISG